MNGARLHVPGYILEARLGGGGSGQVWRARVGATSELVALKRVPIAGGADQARAARAEAAMLATLDHPHLVKLHDVVSVPDALVLVLDLAAGGSLADLVAARGRVTAGEAVTAMSAVGGALAVAQGGELEERPDRRQMRIPAPDAVAARFLDISKEQADQVGVDVSDLQCRRRFLQLLCHVSQE